MYTSDTIMDIKYSGINYKNKIMCILFFFFMKGNKYKIQYYILISES